MSEAGAGGGTVLAALRRRARLLALITVLGALTGYGLAVLRPPSWSSTTLVLLPESLAGGALAQDSAPDVATQVKIVLSATILGAAGQRVSPPVPYQQMKGRVDAEAATARLVEIRASMPTGPQAERLVTAVTEEYLDYVAQNVAVTGATLQATLRDREAGLSDQVVSLEKEIQAAITRQQSARPNSATAAREAELLAQLQVQQADVTVQLDRVKEAIATRVTPGGVGGAGLAVAQKASPASALPTPVWRSLWSAAGALAAGLLGAGGLLLAARRDRRLRIRDDVADAVGCPVLAGVSTRAQPSVRGWQQLLESFRPPAVDAWALRQVLRAVTEPGEDAAPRRVAVVGLAGDEAGASIAPMLASFAAANGVSTRFDLGSGHERLATLWKALSGLQDTSPRSGLLVGGGDGAAGPAGAGGPELVITQHLLDRHTPVLERLDGGVLVAVAAGAATEVELARAALAVDAAGGHLIGIVLGDPERGDVTAGRRAFREPSRPVVQPSRLTGLGAAARRRSG